MAKTTTCDGTGVPIPEDTPVTGLFGHQYCDEARPVAQAYLDDLDALHTAVAEKFADDLAALRAKYRETLQQLPDES